MCYALVVCSPRLISHCDSCNSLNNRFLDNKDHHNNFENNNMTTYQKLHTIRYETEILLLL